MKNIEDKDIPKVRNRRVHMANERTFLAWIRTGIAIMAFGFVVERFAIFTQRFSFLAGKEAAAPPSASSTPFGIILVALGVLMGVLAFIRYKKLEKQIDEDTYRPSPILDVLLAISVIAIGIFLVIYLIHSV